MRPPTSTYLMKVDVWRSRLEAAGLVTLIVTAIFFIATSWLKWFDPLIDFGQQLYNAWQLSTGAVLYRDVGCLYGPLSQYFNAGIFYIFGPGVVVIAIANIVIFGAIAIASYVLFRQAWGILAAWLSTLIFISVFGFSYFVDLGNYNYAAPYAHETTHGMLVSLLLCFVLIRWTQRPTSSASFIAGLLIGMTLVLKPEFIVAAVAMTAMALVIHLKQRGLPSLRSISFLAVGSAAPTVIFTVYFALFMPLGRALHSVCKAWLSVLNPSFSSSPMALRLLGSDQPRVHFFQEASATLFAVLILFVVGGSAALAERKLPRWISLSGLAALMAFFVWIGCSVINWIEIGRCLFALTLLYLLAALFLFLRQPKSPQTNPATNAIVARILIAALGVALLARMFLNPRIYHYGYYQAAVAAMIVPAVMIRELPAWFGQSWRARTAAAAATLCLVLPGIASLATRSQHRFQEKTFAVGVGRDRFYCHPPQTDPMGEIIGTLTETLRDKAKGQTVTVLPEGEFINYLARLRNPVPHPCFYAGAMEVSAESELVTDLQRIPPDWVVVISRDLIGWGIERYGEQTGGGREVMGWVNQNYKQVASLGGDPLDYRQRGAILLRKYAR